MEITKWHVVERHRYIFFFSCFNKTYDVISDQSEALILSNANIVDYEVSYKLQWIQGETRLSLYCQIWI